MTTFLYKGDDTSPDDDVLFGRKVKKGETFNVDPEDVSHAVISRHRWFEKVDAPAAPTPPPAPPQKAPAPPAAPTAPVADNAFDAAAKPADKPADATEAARPRGGKAKE